MFFEMLKITNYGFMNASAKGESKPVGCTTSFISSVVPDGSDKK